MSLRWLFAAVAAGVTVAMVAACGSNQPAAKPGAPPVILAELDAGSYATEPHSATAPRNMDEAEAFEVDRMAKAIPAKSDIDLGLNSSNFVGSA